VTTPGNLEETIKNAAGEERERLMFRLLLINKWFLIPTAVAYEWILSNSPFRQYVYNAILPTILYTAFSLILIILLWMCYRRLNQVNQDTYYVQVKRYLTIILFAIDAVFVFYQFIVPNVGNTLWLLFLPPISLALIVPNYTRNSAWFVDSVASVTLLIVIYYLLASFDAHTPGPRHIPSDVLLCLSGLLFMWVNLRQVSMWIEELNREVANLSNWNLLWSEVLHRLPAEFFLVNERGEVMIASEMARKLIPLPLDGQPDWSPAAQPIRNALLLRFHAETPLNETITIPDDTFPHPIQIYPAFFGMKGKRYCIAWAQEQNPEIPQKSAVMRSDRLSIAGQIAAGLAHELGNPLGVIQSCAAYLRHKSPDDDPNREEYELIEMESHRCQNLIDRLLSLASPKRDTPAVLDMRDILQHSITLVKYQAGSRTLELSVPQIPVYIYANEGQISAVFVNLFLNALQSMEQAPSEAKLRVFMRVRGDEAIVDVTDEGVGITREDLEIIFDPFFTKRAEGTGLGLSIVHQIITSMGGRIDVASTLGSGTTFTVTLPIYQLEDEE
jgi:nitrogen-specific signal transduction histidine kinase